MAQLALLRNASLSDWCQHRLSYCEQERATCCLSICLQELCSSLDDPALKKEHPYKLAVMSDRELLTRFRELSRRLENRAKATDLSSHFSKTRLTDQRAADTALITPPRGATSHEADEFTLGDDPLQTDAFSSRGTSLLGRPVPQASPRRYSLEQTADRADSVYPSTLMPDSPPSPSRPWQPNQSSPSTPPQWPSFTESKASSQLPSR